MTRQLTVIGAALAVGVGIGIGQAAIGGRTDIVSAEPQVQQTAAPAQSVAAVTRSPEEAGVISVARAVSPSVVGITSSMGSGSGVLIRKDGVILTNVHVVGNQRRVQVSLADGRRLTGEVLGGDPRVDVAVVRIPGSNFPAARLGDSDRLEVGQSAIAIGNPYELDRTVTVGVVSAVNRSTREIPLETALIQTDAAINPGNSGGPLLDSSGAVIGINTLMLGQAQGLGFAVPINLANDVATQVLTTGRVVRSFLGISSGDIDPQLAAQFGLPVREGIVVLRIVRGSPADRAGLQPEDIITAINGEPIATGGDLRRILRKLRPGEDAKLSVLRGSSRVTLTAKLAETE